MKSNILRLLISLLFINLFSMKTAMADSEIPESEVNLNNAPYFILLGIVIIIIIAVCYHFIKKIIHRRREK